ncbi:Uncharacterized protein TCM_005556 [Theobroma cacao]|uniref:Uncharacterized protein n=1 Tax=Theobroma cacao TaxID=3641 RepID=A0A061E1Z6_THECC|nr:Uncharacterized protein TCM_005556 [Theobroma cacao]
MSIAGALDLFDHSPSLFSLFYEEPELSFPFYVFEPTPVLSGLFLSPFDQAFDAVTDVTRLLETPLSSRYRRIGATDELELCSGALLDRISGLEFGTDRFKQWDRKYTWKAEIKSSDKSEANRKYQYTSEIKGLEGRKYEWTAEIESPEKNGTDGKYKWTAEMIKGGKVGNVEKKKQCKVEIQGTQKKEVPLKIKVLGSQAVGKEETKGECSVRVVEIEEPADHAAMLLRQVGVHFSNFTPLRSTVSCLLDQSHTCTTREHKENTHFVWDLYNSNIIFLEAFGRRAGAVARLRGKRKVLSPDEAALVIERTFRAYLIRRSKALRSLRELAVAKAKLKEIRALFNNYSYRQNIARDAEGRQRFSERIIALVLTVDAIQGADLMVRGARRSMLDELEAMLDAVDPNPSGKLGLLKWQAV